MITMMMMWFSLSKNPTGEFGRYFSNERELIQKPGLNCHVDS